MSRIQDFSGQQEIARKQLKHIDELEKRLNERQGMLIVKNNELNEKNSELTELKSQLSVDKDALEEMRTLLERDSGDGIDVCNLCERTFCSVVAKQIVVLLCCFSTFVLVVMSSKESYSAINKDVYFL